VNWFNWVKSDRWFFWFVLFSAVMLGCIGMYSETIFRGAALYFLVIIIYQKTQEGDLK